jgi:hypothetical protein
MYKFLLAIILVIILLPDNVFSISKNKSTSFIGADYSFIFARDSAYGDGDGIGLNFSFMPDHDVYANIKIGYNNWWKNSDSSAIGIPIRFDVLYPWWKKRQDVFLLGFGIGYNFMTLTKKVYDNSAGEIVEIQEEVNGLSLSIPVVCYRFEIFYDIYINLFGFMNIQSQASGASGGVVGASILYNL